MDATGYMITANLHGETLTVTGTTKVARVALRGADHAAGPLVLQLGDVDQVEWRGANMVRNGQVTIRTRAGAVHVLHFRRPQQPDMLALYDTVQQRLLTVDG